MYMEWRNTERSIILRGLIEFSIYWTEHLCTRFSPRSWTGSLNKGVDPGPEVLVFLGRRRVLFSRVISALPREVRALWTVRPWEGKWLGLHSQLAAMPGLNPELPDLVPLLFFRSFLFIFGFPACLLLHRGFLWLWWAGTTFLCGVLGSFCFRTQAFGAWPSVVVAYRLSCPKAYAVFQDQGSNPCLRHQ